MTARLDVAMLRERGLVPAPLPVAPLLTAAEEARERSVGTVPAYICTCGTVGDAHAGNCALVVGAVGFARRDPSRMVGADRGASERTTVPGLSAAESALLASVDDALEVLRSLACTEVHSDGCARCARAQDAADVIRTTFDFAGAWTARSQRRLDDERRRVAAVTEALRVWADDVRAATVTREVNLDAVDTALLDALHDLEAQR